MSESVEPELPQGVRLERGIVFGTGGGRDLHLDLAGPKEGGAKTRPAVVFIHGGGWNAADRTNGWPLITLLAEHGFVAASVDYRLTGEAGFPAQLEDCKCAVRYLRAHAEKYGIDPKRIGSAGGSAGGHLAALVGLVPEEAGFEGSGGWEGYSSGVSAVADLYGVSDVAALGAEDGMATLLMRGKPEEKPELYRSGSPLSWVRPGVPPFYLMHGDRDDVVPLSHSERLMAALQEVGTAVSLRVIEGLGHGSIATLPEVTKQDVVGFFRRYLAGG